jgi:hypothetical protein
MVGLTEALLPLIDLMGPKLAQAINDSIPILEGFIAEIKNINDTTTFTGGTIQVLLDVFGAFFSFITQNFGVLLTLTALIGGLTTALNLYAAAAAWASVHPIGLAILLLGSAFIIGANGANELTTELQKNKAAADSLNPELNALAYSTEYAGGKFGIMAGATSNATAETRRLRDELLLLESQLAGSLSVYGGGKQLRSTMAAENRKKGSAASQAAAAQNASMAAAAAAAQKAAQEQAAREQLAAQQQAAREQLAAQEKAARELADAQEKAWQIEQDILQKRADAYESFADSVKSIFGGIKESILSSFSLPELGNSVNSITKNIQKLLARTKDFARNINSLSQQGLTNDLLQQVIAAGPMQGGKLAQALARGGTGFIGQINQAYSEFGGLAGSIAGVGTRTAFGNQQTINNYIEINGGLATGADVGRAVVNAIKDFERQSGAAWRA